MYLTCAKNTQRLSWIRKSNSFDNRHHTEIVNNLQGSTANYSVPLFESGLLEHITNCYHCHLSISLPIIYKMKAEQFKEDSLPGLSYSTLFRDLAPFLKWENNGVQIRTTRKTAVCNLS